MWKILALAFLPSLVLAQRTHPIPPSGSGAPEAAAQKLRPATIEGTVVNSATGEPVRKVNVRLTAMGRPDGYEAATDASGSFRIANIAPGRYMLNAERAGFVRTAGESNRGLTLTLGEDETLRGHVVKLTPQGVIMGRITDEDGDPVQGAHIELMRHRYINGRKQLVPASGQSTNDLGDFRISGLAPGKYYLSAAKPQSDWSRRIAFNRNGAPALTPLSDAPDLSYVKIFYPGTTEASSANPIQILPGVEIQGLNIQLQKAPTFRVRGRVIGGESPYTASHPNAGQQRWGGANVMLIPASPAGVFFSGGVRPAPMQQRDGHFEIANVRPGSYVLFASQNGPNGRYTRMPIQVGGGHLDGLEIALQPPIQLTGTIVAESGTLDVSNVQIHLQQNEGIPMGGSGSGRNLKNSAFTIGSLSPLKYRLNVSGLPQGYFIKSVQYGQQDITETDLDLSGGAAGELKILVASGAPQLQGVVQNEKGEPAAQATVTLIPDGRLASFPEMFRIANSDQLGAFTFAGLRPGAYRVMAWEEIEPGAQQDPEFIKPFESRAATVKLEQNGQETVQLKVIPRSGT